MWTEFNHFFIVALADKLQQKNWNKFYHQTWNLLPRYFAKCECITVQLCGYYSMHKWCGCRHLLGVKKFDGTCNVESKYKNVFKHVNGDCGAVIQPVFQRHVAQLQQHHGSCKYKHLMLRRKKLRSPAGTTAGNIFIWCPPDNNIFCSGTSRALWETTK